MKKFLFGLIIFLLGAVVSLFNYINAVQNPCSYNGIEGLYGAFLGRGTLSITIVFIIVLVIGLGICGFEAYRKK
jgi:hypothetical protein